MYKTKQEVLIDSLIKLSLDSNDQIKVYNLEIPIADELALEFDDAFITIRNEPKLITQKELLKILEEIDFLLAKMSTNEYKKQYLTAWEEIGLFDNVDWFTVRKLANKALILLKF